MEIYELLQEVNTEKDDVYAFNENYLSNETVRNACFQLGLQDVKALNYKGYIFIYNNLHKNNIYDFINKCLIQIEKDSV